MFMPHIPAPVNKKQYIFQEIIAEVLLYLILGFSLNPLQKRPVALANRPGHNTRHIIAVQLLDFSLDLRKQLLPTLENHGHLFGAFNLALPPVQGSMRRKNIGASHQPLFNKGSGDILRLLF